MFFKNGIKRKFWEYIETIGNKIQEMFMHKDRLKMMSRAQRAHA